MQDSALFYAPGVQYLQLSSVNSNPEMCTSCEEKSTEAGQGE